MVDEDEEDPMTQRTMAITGGHGVLGRAVLEAALKAGGAHNTMNQFAAE